MSKEYRGQHMDSQDVVPNATPRQTAIMPRTSADVFLSDGTNLNHTLVKDGWCWWYRKYAPGDTVLEGLEKDARNAKQGLWVDPAPIPPWIYRKARRGQALDLSDLVPLESEPESSATSRGPPRLGAVQSESSPDTTSSEGASEIRTVC